MAQDMMSLFKTIILVQIFFSVAITMLAYAMPDESLQYVNGFTDLAGEVDIEGVRNDIQGSVENQLDIPVIELGALIFYSGNIIIDLLLNFFFAVPEMIGLIFNGLLLLFNIDSFLFAYVELFSAVTITVMYFIGLLQLLIGIRSGRGTII